MYVVEKRPTKENVTAREFWPSWSSLFGSFDVKTVSSRCALCKLRAYFTWLMIGELDFALVGGAHQTGQKDHCDLHLQWWNSLTRLGRKLLDLPVRPIDWKLLNGNDLCVIYTATPGRWYEAVNLKKRPTERKLVDIILPLTEIEAQFMLHLMLLTPSNVSSLVGYLLLFRAAIDTFLVVSVTNWICWKKRTPLKK